MNMNENRNRINWTLVIIALIAAAAILLYPTFGHQIQAPAAADAVPPTAPLSPAEEAVVPTYAAPAPLVNNQVTVNNTQLMQPAAPVQPAEPVAPPKGSATNPMTVDELVTWMETTGSAGFNVDGRGSGITWGAVMVNGLYADLSSIESDWIGPVPFISVSKCASAGFQQKQVGSYCFSPFQK